MSNYDELDEKCYGGPARINQYGRLRSTLRGPWAPVPHWLIQHSKVIPEKVKDLILHICRENYSKDRGPRNFQRFSARSLGYVDPQDDQSPLGVHYTQAGRILRKAISLGFIVEREKAQGRRPGRFDLNTDQAAIAAGIEKLTAVARVARNNRSYVASRALHKRKANQAARGFVAANHATQPVASIGATQNVRSVAPDALHLLKERVKEPLKERAGGAGRAPGAGLGDLRAPLAGLLDSRPPATEPLNPTGGGLRYGPPKDSCESFELDPRASAPAAPRRAFAARESATADHAHLSGEGSPASTPVGDAEKASSASVHGSPHGTPRPDDVADGLMPQASARPDSGEALSAGMQLLHQGLCRIAGDRAGVAS